MAFSIHFFPNEGFERLRTALDYRRAAELFEEYCVEADELPGSEVQLRDAKGHVVSKYENRRKAGESASE
jgi:hypothetical protein